MTKVGKLSRGVMLAHVHDAEIEIAEVPEPSRACGRCREGFVIAPRTQDWF
jgi:hypothetical protein